MSYRALWTISALLAGVSLLGCVESGSPIAHPTPPPLLTEPVGVQLTRIQPRLAGMPFRVLLDFEQASDLAFLAGNGLKTSSEEAHTGKNSLAIDPGQTVRVKLGSVLGSAPFPGKWTIAGAYFRAAEKAGQRVTIAYRASDSGAALLQRTAAISPSAWTGIFIDLTALPAGKGSAGVLTIAAEGKGTLFCDDVLLMNNDRILVAPDPGAAPLKSWSIHEKGFSTVIDKPGHFRISIKTPEAEADGWAVEEANELRARFSAAGGKSWTLYMDGRQYQGGAFVPQTVLKEAAAIFTAQQNAPADILVEEEFGRIDRDTPGDRNNDGYNEQRGSYELVAKGPRFEVTLKPRTDLLAYPVLEIRGLPAGNVLATVEGQLIEKTTRLANGNLLVNVPLTLERATAIHIQVK